MNIGALDLLKKSYLRKNVLLNFKGSQKMNEAFCEKQVQGLSKLKIKMVTKTFYTY